MGGTHGTRHPESRCAGRHPQTLRWLAIQLHPEPPVDLCNRQVPGLPHATQDKIFGAGTQTLKSACLSSSTGGSKVQLH